MFVTVSNHVKRIQRLRNCGGLSNKNPPVICGFLSFNRIRIAGCVVVPVDSFYLGSPRGKKATDDANLGHCFFQDVMCFSAENSLKYMEDVFEYVFLETSLSFSHMKPPTKMCHDEKRRPSSFLQNHTQIEWLEPEDDTKCLCFQGC